MGLTGDKELDKIAAAITNADIAASRAWLERFQYGKLSGVEKQVAKLAGLYADEGEGFLRQTGMTKVGSAFLHEQREALDSLEKFVGGESEAPSA